MGRYIKNRKDHNIQCKVEKCFTEDLKTEIEKAKKNIYIDFSNKMRKTNEKQNGKLLEL
jgi:hypothetical protein